MKLLIVESPSKAKTIEKYLGKDFRVVASVGHIRDLPKSNKSAIDIPAGFVPHYEVVKGKEKIISEIKLQARRVLDRLVGYDLSGLIWKKVRYGLSAGRVQSPALRIIVEREREIRAFKSETYYIITADVFGKNNTVFRVTCEEEPKDIKTMKTILEKSKTGSWFVKDITESEVKRLPRSPFTTSTLQQAASSCLGFSPARTMIIAQKLYEQGFITYMRTDSMNIASSAQTTIAGFIEKTYGKEYVEVRTYKTKSKNAQEAHEAIRPTNATQENAGYNDEQKKLYRLIRERTISSQMSDAKLLRSKIITNINDGGDFPNFSTTGSRVMFDGWLACDTRARGEDVELPKINKNEKLTLKDMASEEKHTEPPPRYTEAGLVKELEKRGIGRPSTYASIIKTLYDRKYVEKEGRSLKPTDTGDVVSSFLEENFMNYISDTFTAEMENELDDIATGTREYLKTLKDFYTPFLKDVKAKDKIEKITNLGDAPAEFLCPICDGKMIIKLGKNGKFMSCAKFPD